VHRTLAIVIALTAVALGLRLPRAGASERARLWSDFLLLAVAIQLGLGISTLLLRVPVPLAALHQSGAVLVFTCALGVLHSVVGRSAAARTATAGDYRGNALRSGV
jgi:cytochrome c oxidase assembly protein subunit 15